MSLGTSCVLPSFRRSLGLLVRFSHCQRAHIELFTVVPQWRAAWVRWLSVVISEAAAMHCFSLCSTEHLFQIQNQAVFRATQRTGPTGAPSESTAKDIISARISCPMLAASIVPLLDWLPECCGSRYFAILTTPTHLVTTPLHFLL